MLCIELNTLEINLHVNKFSKTKIKLMKKNTLQKSVL